MQDVESDWKDLNHRLESHLININRQTDSFEEYQEYQPLDKIETPLPLSPDVEKLLQDYFELVRRLRS